MLQAMWPRSHYLALTGAETCFASRQGNVGLQLRLMSGHRQAQLDSKTKRDRSCTCIGSLCSLHGLGPAGRLVRVGEMVCTADLRNRSPFGTFPHTEGAFFNFTERFASSLGAFDCFQVRGSHALRVLRATTGQIKFLTA